MMPSSPMEDSRLGGRSGKGVVDAKKLKETADVWGKLPEKERAKAMLELTRSLCPECRAVVDVKYPRVAWI